MSSVLADFTARFDIEADEITSPTQGRIVLGKEQLVLAATENEQVTIPVSSIIDVTTGSVPGIFPSRRKRRNS